MQSIGIKPFTFDFQEILIDEIALEGLEGTGIDLLWARLEHRTCNQITDKMKERLWNIVIRLIEKGRVELYQLPEPVPLIEIIDRFSMIDQDSGDIKDPDFYLDGPYEYCPCTDTFGSSKYYTTRKLIPLDDIKGIPLSKIINNYGCTLVLVACMDDRWRALAPHLPENCMKQLTNLQYCLLELIGKGRENGQTTFGMTNILKVIKEPKTLFYYRKTLQNLNIVKACHITQFSCSRSVKSILLRLARFHKPHALSLPKIGKIHDIVEYLKTKPDYMDRTDDIWRKGLLTQHHLKRLRKTINIFGFHEQMVQDTVSTKRQPEPHLSLRKRKFISINPQSDESSQSEGETEPPLKCQFKVGIGIMRQAAERFQDAGKKGLTQVQLGQMLGIPFYTARNICRVFRQRKIIKEFFEDRGKQRVSRFVIRTGLDSRKFDQEAKTFLKYVNENKANYDTGNTSPQPSTSQAAIQEQDKTIDDDSANKHISEVKQFEGVKIRTNAVSMMTQLKAGNLTLRQLKFANGLLKVVKEHQCITGYQTISNMVAKEINQSPMVTKALKAFLQRLVIEGHLKVFKVRWPGVGNENKYINVVCAPHIKATDPIVRAKYKEVYLRAMQKKHQQNIKKETLEPPTRPLATYINPRYMKIQNLHESIMEMVYFDPLPDSIGVHKGFLSVTEFLHEITVKFAISSMSSSGLTEVAHLRISDEQLNMKIKDAPVELGHFIIKSKSLRNSIRMCLKVLAMHGLIQLIYRPDLIGVDYTSNFLSSFTFYVNRNARIVNTTGHWPRENVDIKSLEKSYYFNNSNDVTDFWNDVYEISIATKILVKNRIKKKIDPPLRMEQDVKLYDNGDRYGDGNGPCGFDSCFFMEIPRLWHTFYVRKTKPPTSTKKKIKVNRVTKKKARKAKQPPKAKPPPKMQPIKIMPLPADARKRRNEHPTKWSTQEDFVIIMCLIAITITSPNSQPGSLRVRNMVAKDILSVKDPFKTQTACHRRTLVLQMNPTSMHERDCLLNEMKRRRYLIQKYEGLIKKLRLRYSTNITKFINEARIPMLELVYLIKQVSKSEFFHKRLPCIAENYEKFHETYDIVKNTSHRAYNIYTHPELCYLRESVFFTIMLAYNNEVKTELAKKIFSIFKNYPEQSLRTVVDQLRKSGAISAKEKIFNNQMHRLHLEDIVQSAYKISAKYQQRWMSRLNTDFIVCLGQVIQRELPVHFKGSSELNCLFSELQCSGHVNLVSGIPPNVVDMTDSKLPEEQINVLDIETKYKLKSGTIMWEPTSSTYEKLEKTEKGVKCSNLFKNNGFLEAIKSIESNNVIILPNQTAVLFLNDAVVQYLCEKKEQGCTFKELQDFTGYETKQLITKLNFFESKGTLKRVGYTDNYIVIMTHIKQWSLKVEDKFILVTPWMNMEFEIRYDVFLEWAGVIMNKIFENPGCSVQYISRSFELITPKAVQDVCNFLMMCNCITMYSLSFEEIDLFSDGDTEPDLCEYNPYSPVDQIVMFPMIDSMCKYASLRKAMLDSYLCKQSKSKKMIIESTKGFNE